MIAKQKLITTYFLAALIAFVATLANAGAMECGMINDRLAPLDQEAIELVQALKPTKYCDGKQFKAALKVLNKTVTVVEPTEQQRKDFLAKQEAAALKRVAKRLQKAGITN